MERGSFLFTADGRLISRPVGDVEHEATDPERWEAGERLWPDLWWIVLPATGGSSDG